MGKYAKTALLIAGFAGSVAFGENHWYVDAENGNDRWNGQASFSGVVQTDDVGPKKTFSKLFADCQIGSGDVVHAAAGTYSNLTMTADTGVKGEYRVVVPAGRSNQSILEEISSEYSLEGRMLKLKFQYFGHLI